MSQRIVNTTASDGLSAEMRVFYSDYLIDNAQPKLVHDQFGQKHPIPKNGARPFSSGVTAPCPRR